MITIVTFYNNGSVETYVGAVVGETTKEQELEMASRLCLEEGDMLGFRRVEPVAAELLIKNAEENGLENAFPDACCYDGPQD